MSTGWLEGPRRLRAATRSARGAPRLAVEETNDAIAVLTGGGLHPQAVVHLRDARRFVERAGSRYREGLIGDAVEALRRARAELVEPS